ncbi:histidine--tRNA ligase [Finegoldia magna]|uniref:Histidine--tRNA ligase n=2 Tax=Finegoldia magna TaxID=1260 RepID=A0A133MY06_FINMA|nr:histidine--tRNA ligase [Finegoldia magna]EFK93603.1 histidine--tRNA ligase [Finegoldia magna ACS-171-V-Col3]EFL54569.1 histidine--tRNA ligase [Finegoldia magna BVS033A4]EXF26968.1 histidyl-tRNA synthase [Finegoldia magna ALB8]KXA08932.1 histidine--tRNA ligase [Finegoldia magna]MDU1212895.1 histidine--tRNA ligase [Finegoldia magna]
MIQPSTLPGMMELLPEDQLVFDTIKRKIEDVFIKNAFFSIDTPAIEKLDVLLSKGGGETSKQVFRIDNSKKNQGLRFDLTVPLAKYVSMYMQDLAFPFRRYQIAKVYRGERNQKGRYKEFYQCDIDIIGNEKLSLYNDAEIVKCMYEALKSIDVPEFEFQFNNRKILNGYFSYLGIDDFESCLRVIDKLDKIGIDNVKEELSKINLDASKIDTLLKFLEIDGTNQEIIEKLESLNIDNELFTCGVNELKFVYQDILSLGVNPENIKINLSITRGLDYYTGSVFETFFKDYPEIGSICSGGRYDSLANNFTKSKLPGVGMSIGLTRLFYQLQELNLVKGKQTNFDCIIIPMKGYEKNAVKLMNDLRNSSVKCMSYLEDDKLKKKFNYADKLSVKYVIIIGQDEVEQNKFTLRNMENGNQELLELNEIIEKLK